MGFLRQVTGQKKKRQRDGTWRSETSAEVLKEAVTQTLGVYIDKAASNSGGVGAAEEDTLYLRKGYRLRGRGELM